MTADDSVDRVLWDAFVETGEPRRYPAGAALFLEGDAPGAVFAILAGEVRITSEHDGTDVVLSTSRPGQLLGEVSAIDGLPRSATATAVTDVDSVTMPAGRFNQLLEQHPALAIRIMRLLANRLRHSTDERVRHQRGDAVTRVAAVIAAAAAERGDAVGTALTVAIDRQELAAAVAGDHEVTSRALAGLAGEGWIELADGGLTVLNLPALRSLGAEAGRSST